MDLDLRPDDVIQVGGSPHSSKLYIVAARGLLNICDLRAADCDRVVPLAGTGDLGGPIEAGSRLFVPDYGSGEVWIIDLNDYQVIAKSQVLTGAGKFQLLNRDGVMFFNEPLTERAGVIQLDGSVMKANKYDPGNPDQGIKAAQTTTSSRRQASSSATSSSSAAPPPPSTDTEPPVNLKIRVSKATPMVNEDVTFAADADGIAPASAQWDFADGKKGTGLPVAHQWSDARNYLVTVQAVMPDGRLGTASLNVTVSLTPKFRLTVTTNDGGTVKSADGNIACAAKSTCVYDYDQGTHVSLSPQAQPDFAFSQWGDGGCAKSGATCDVTMNSTQNASALFKPTAARLTVQIAAAGGSVKLNNQACNACTLQFSPGQNVPVQAIPDQDHDFDTWDSRTCADVHAASCTTQADTTRIIVARFKPKPKYTRTVKYSGKGGWYGRVKIDSTRSGSKTCLSDANSTPCTTEYTVGEKLTLTADSTQTSFFAGWQDACKGSPNDVCSLTMTGPMTATADYDILH
jgi:hypothetical protein